MRILKVLLFIFLLQGCSSATKSKSIEASFILKEKYEDLSPDYIKWMEYKVKDEQEAKEKIKSLEASLARLSEPTVDPYSNESDLPQECLSQNLPPKIQRISEAETSLAYSLFSSPRFFLGCMGTQKVKAQSLLLYCKKTQSLSSIIAIFNKGSWPEEAVAICKK
jgi:hypothetical protein